MRNINVKERWTEENFQEMAGLWELTEEDQNKLRQLQQRIADIDHWKNDPFEVIRYYKEYKGNLPKVEKMFRHMIRWREEHNMEVFLDNYGEPDPLFHQMPIVMLDSTDRDGDPIYVDRMGVADSWSLLKHFGTDAMTDYILFIRELNNSRAFWKPYEDRVGHRVRNFTVITDLHGLSSGHMRPGLLPLLQRTARVSQDCYAGWGKVSNCNMQHDYLAFNIGTDVSCSGMALFVAHHSAESSHNLQAHLVHCQAFLRPTHPGFDRLYQPFRLHGGPSGIH